MKKFKKQIKKALSQSFYVFVILTFLFQSSGGFFMNRVSAADEVVIDITQVTEELPEGESLSEKNESDEDSKPDSEQEAEKSTESDLASDKSELGEVEKNETTEIKSSELSNSEEQVLENNGVGETAENISTDDYKSKENVANQENNPSQNPTELNNEKDNAKDATEVSGAPETSTKVEKEKANNDSESKSDNKKESNKKSEEKNEEHISDSANEEIIVTAPSDIKLESSDPAFEEATTNNEIGLSDGQIEAISALPEKIDEFLASSSNWPNLFGEQQPVENVLPEIKKETWQLVGDKAVANDPVELGKTYIAPQNNQVSVTFTALPEIPGTLSIEEITLSDEQVVEFGALSNKAYDITSTMENGSFEYDLTLPKSNEKEIAQIIYTEKSAEDLRGASVEDFKAINNEQTEVNQDSVRANGVDHFTVFVVVNGSTAQDDDTVGNFVWSNPGRARTTNDAYASTSLTSQNPSHYLKITDFSPNVPAGSVIEGIEIKIERRQSCAVASCTSNVKDANVKLVKSGNIVGDDKAKTTNWPTSDTVVTYGGPTDLWGTTWTAAQINNINTGVVLSVQRSASGNRDVFVDHIEMTVYYAPPHTITASAGTGGAISPSGSITVNDGTDQIFTITPEVGYIVSDVLVDSTSVGRKNSYSFTGVSADHTISASFDGDWKAPSNFVSNNNVGTPGQVYSSNDSYATFNSDADRVDYKSFDFEIPAGNIIDGIEVALEGVRPTAGTRKLTAELSWDNGASFTTEKTATGWGDTDRTIVLGGPNAKWGRSWNSTELKNAQFRIRIGGTTGNDAISLDQVQARVSYHLDATSPVITLSGGNPVTVERGDSYSEPGATWTDNLDGEGDVTDITGTVDTNTVGDYAISYSYTDAAGNNTTENRTVSVVDTTSPTAEIDYLTIDWTNGDVTATLINASESITITNNDGSTEYIFTDNGDFTFEFSDGSGNGGSATATVSNIDKQGPDDPNFSPVAGEYLADQSVDISSSDSGSGLDKIYYTIDGSNPDNTKTEFTGSILVDKDITIRAIAYDKVGNSSNIIDAIYEIAPVITKESSGSATTNSITITWTTDDPATSRVIYDTVSHPDISGFSAPNYGYANSTVEDSNKVLNHSVKITGLSAGKSYYFRTVSHGSPETVSSEQNFSTSRKSDNDDDDDDDDNSDNNASSASSSGIRIILASNTGSPVEILPNNSSTDQADEEGIIKGYTRDFEKDPIEETASQKSDMKNSGRLLWWIWALAILILTGIVYFVRRLYINSRSN